MRSNTRAVIEALKAGKAKRSCEAIWTDGRHVFSYRTCILATRPDGTRVLNRTKYSVTTTIHQNALYDFKAEVVDNVIQGATPEDVLTQAEIQRKRSA